MRHCGILYQSGALWSSMTLAENIAVPLEEYTKLSHEQVRKLTSLKLSLVGLAGFDEYYPSEISGGMKKRAGLARAIALDPDILFFDEPSAGLDPISAHLLDELILELRDSLGATIVIVTHELASIFAIGNNSVFIDAEAKTMLATGNPKRLLEECAHPTVRNFLTRGEAKAEAMPGEVPGPCFLRLKAISLGRKNMSKAANKTMIGAFVVGAIALAAIAVAIFGSGVFLQKTQDFETFFEGSVQGLNVGAPVIFRGVQVGSVKDISLEFQPAKLAFSIPVVIVIYPDKAKWLGPHPKTLGENVNRLIDKGLRAQLISQSLITGQLAVGLDFFPDKPARFVGIDKKYPEIPSVPSNIEEISKTIQELPIKEILAKVNSTVSGLNNLINSESTRATLKSIEQMLKETNIALKTVNVQIGPLLTNLQSTSGEIRSTVAHLDREMSGEKGMVEISKKTMVQAEQTLVAVRQIAQENSAMGQDFGQAVEEMGKSFRSLRVLSDYLERHPESIVWGKK